MFPDVFSFKYLYLRTQVAIFVILRPLILEGLTSSQISRETLLLRQWRMVWGDAIVRQTTVRERRSQRAKQQARNFYFRIWTSGSVHEASVSPRVALTFELFDCSTIMNSWTSAGLCLTFAIDQTRLSSLYFCIRPPNCRQSTIKHSLARLGEVVTSSGSSESGVFRRSDF